ELVTLAGGTPAGAEPGRPAPTVEPTALAALRPEVVVVKPCGFTVERALAERDVIERLVVAAVGPATRVYVTDGNAYFNRPGPPPPPPRSANRRESGPPGRPPGLSGKGEKNPALPFPPPPPRRLTGVRRR